ncbi:coatomer subunit gamma KNAG_0K02280 [Huiozyma naganishii CBS 8797]|uniref:Coatomer subunit gamma n=1 Tax=Huiozyma naganishii (strain ATCC MYA-139 / BCRC 22969 / CBS 8797 / KCTC 17520 / NBRC 10181 / NCYC 3082 / Yp74L-3) TaxID=1071383 RepID=J7SAZ3_HUIN7|nr:hypothetical protein KNAG_0K02280 [Kazachstania naganishii CBS 8797]CCK72591.1 hypothetical protein KNAG_0K02280 [Kazachstania naganishii CBS 8797]
MSAQTYKKFESAGSSDLPDKMTIYQDCMNTFNESPVSAKRCRLLISRLLRLLSSGETFPQTEATALFFSISKLFQHQNDSLRQVVYLAIKELSGISEDVLMATSSIMKDVQNGSDIVKPNAIRALTYVLDESTAFSAERLLKNAVVSKNQSVSSAALCTAYNLLPISEVTIKRFSNEAQEAIMEVKTAPMSARSEFVSKAPHITQYHALGLVYELKRNDKMALMKLIQQCSDGFVLKNQFARMELMKIVNDLIHRDTQLFAQFQQLFNVWLQDRSSLVSLETAKTITTFAIAHPRLVSPDLFATTVNVLRKLMNEFNCGAKLGAVKVVNKMAMVSPEKVAVCNPELESLLSMSNKELATFAITTLLKTSNEDNISNLIGRITEFVHKVSDDFKITVIEAIRTLSLKFPKEWKVIIKFLIDVLKNSEGAAKFKSSVVEAIIDIVAFVPQSKELALESLCDFIEDCEYNEVLVRVLHLLGKEGPSTSNPSLYVRHIFNRVVLENSIIRSAAVIALSKFALTKNDPTLKDSIVSLLNRISNDTDDEVRDRATISLKLLGSEHSFAKDLVQSKYYYDLNSLESKLTTYISTNEDSFKTPFDVSQIRKFSEDEMKAIELKHKQDRVFKSTDNDESGNRDAIAPATVSTNKRKDNDTYKGADLHEHEQDLLESKYADELSGMEEFKEFGKLINSSKVTPLTESEAEFVVRAVKHVFKDNIVLQFNITNTLVDVALDNVSVVCSAEDPENSRLEELFTLPIERLAPAGESACYVAFKKSTDTVMKGFLNTLHFTTRELNPDTHEPFEDDEGFQDEYEIDSLFLNAGDYIKSSFVGNFEATFDQLPNEEVAVYNIQEDLSLQEVIDKLVLNTSCLPLSNTQFAPTDSSSHVLKLFGKSALMGTKVALVIKMIKSSKGVALKAQCRTEDATLCADIVNNLM